MMKKIDDGILDELLKGCERPEALPGDGGLMRDLKKALMQRMLGAELTEHLGYEHGQEPSRGGANDALGGETGRRRAALWGRRAWWSAKKG